MKDNCHLLNCRRNICDALDKSGVNNPIRPQLVQALTQLDAFRHGQLQKCDKCTDYDHGAELEKCPI